MTKTIIVWFRADLRIHDHPALASAVKDGDHVIPLFILDDNLLLKKQSSNRNRFLLECLHDLKKSLKTSGGDLVIRKGEPEQVLIELAKETSSEAVYYTADFSPYALKRDKKVTAALEKNDIEVKSFGGKLTVNTLQKLKTQAGDPFKVFTPFWKQWMGVDRGKVLSAPTKLHLPDVKVGDIPEVNALTNKSELSENVSRGGETEARKRFNAFIGGDIDVYREENNNMGRDTTSRLSPYLHFGCLSTRELETMLPDNEGARSWNRQLAWRDFYYYVLFHFPHPEQEFQERFRTLKWSYDKKDFEAWQNGLTGYPVVDAAMRQLKSEGWMHNRARLIVGSFLTKDLGLDWRMGEAHFMKWLLDGDTANNNGNWQWIASVGVDPAPLFRRLYNPTRQQESYDPNGIYVRKYVPELKNVKDAFLAEPSKMTDEEQREAKCIIGKDYPEPMIDHKEAREATIARYKI